MSDIDWVEQPRQYILSLVCHEYMCVCDNAWTHQAQVLVDPLVQVTKMYQGQVTRSHEGHVLVVALRLYK